MIYVHFVIDYKKEKVLGGDGRSAQPYFLFYGKEQDRANAKAQIDLMLKKSKAHEIGINVDIIRDIFSKLGYTPYIHDRSKFPEIDREEWGFYISKLPKKCDALVADSGSSEGSDTQDKSS